MNTTHTRKLCVTAAVGAATALLFLRADAAHAVPDVSEHGGLAIIDHLPTPRTCAGCVGFDPQPEPPALRDRRNNADIGNPNDHPETTAPGNSVGLGGPDTLPPQYN